MAAVVVAIRNKRYDAEEAQGTMFDNKQLLTSFPPESERKADLIMQKYMIDGYVWEHCVSMMRDFGTEICFLFQIMAK
jgi:hypothetical protein